MLHQHMYVNRELDRVIFSAFAVFATCDCVLVGSVTCANDTSCNVDIRCDEGPWFLHQLTVSVCKPVRTPVELAFDETVRPKKLDDLGVLPVPAWCRPLHTYNTSSFQDFPGKVPETPK